MAYWYRLVVGTPRPDPRSPRLIQDSRYLWIQRWVGLRPPGIVLLVAYKAITAVVLFSCAVALGVARLHYRELVTYTLPTHRMAVTWVLQHLAQIQPHTLEFAAAAAALYALLSGLEAIGLWYERHWARWLVLIGVGAGFPVELHELLHKPDLPRLLLFLANCFAFWYVLQRFPKRSLKAES